MAVNVQAAVEAQLLGINLTGMVSKTSEEMTDVETNQKKIKTTVEFLIMPSALDKNDGITVEKVVDEINRMVYKVEHNVSDIEIEKMKKEKKSIPDMITVNSINNALSFVGLENALLTFTQTFIHYKKVVKRDAPSEQNKSTDVGTQDGGSEEEIDKIVEYAIGIHIEGDKKQSDDFKFLEIKEIYINVWDTTNSKILERLQIWTPDQLEQK